MVQYSLYYFYLFFQNIFNLYSVYSRINAIFTFQQLDPSTYIRYVNNKIAGEIILDYALFGVGLVNIVLIIHINIYLNMIQEISEN